LSHSHFGCLVDCMQQISARNKIDLIILLSYS
jgi:hypothetical protein